MEHLVYVYVKETAFFVFCIHKSLLSSLHSMAYINKTNAAALSFLKEARRVNLLLNAAGRLHLLPHCSSGLGGKQCMRIPCCCMQQRGPIGAPFACKYNGNVFSASFAANRRRSLSVEQMFKGLYCMRFFSDGPRRGASLNKSIIKEKNYYVLLGVKENEKTAGIRAAYLRLAKTLHPDVNVRCTDKKNKERQFKEVKEAYEVLINPQKRKEYDERIRNSINRKQQTTAAAAAEAADQQVYRHCRNVWHEGRNEFGEEFWNQVNQIKREKDRARNTMKVSPK